MLNKVVKTLSMGCCICIGVASHVVAAEYDHTVEAKDISFSWKIDGDKLAGKVTAETEGWVGVGFNPTDKMKDANFVIGYVKNGKVTILDEFGTTPTGHKYDKKIGGTDDVTVVGGSEEDGVTSLEFIIPLATGDEKDRVIEPESETTLLLAYGAGRDSFRSKHKYRTSMKVNLSTGEAK